MRDTSTRKYCEFPWLGASVGSKDMTLPLQTSIGPALQHNDPEKKDVKLLIRQEAMSKLTEESET